MLYIVIWDLSASTVFFHITLQTTWLKKKLLSSKYVKNFIELNRLYTTQLTVVILQLVTSATCFGLVWPSSGLQRLVSIKVHNVAVPMGSHRYSNIMYSTLIDTNLCKPDDGQTRPKHVADVASCRITTANCVCKDGLIQ